MKVSELRSLVTRLVAEEVARQVPQVLTEMFVKQLVQECVGAVRPLVERSQSTVKSPVSTVPRPGLRRPARPSSLQEAIGDFDPTAGAEFYSGMEYEDAPEDRSTYPTPARERPHTVIPEGLDPSLAGMVDEDTVRGLEMHSGGPTQSIPLERATGALPGLDFSKQRALLEAMNGNDRRKRA